MWPLALFAATTLLGVALIASAKDGVVDLDSLSWPLVVDGSRDVLVAFKQFHHTEPAHWKEVAAHEDLRKEGAQVLVATVDCHNDPKLCEKYGVDGPSSNYPQIKFFARGLSGDKPAALFFGEEEVAEYVDLVLLQQRPQMAGFKDLAEDFLKVGEGERKEKLTAARELLADVQRDGTECSGEGTQRECTSSPPDAQLVQSAKFYVAAMERVLAKGTGFIEAEIDRIDLLVDSPSTSKEKKKEFRVRLGCLDDFRYEELEAGKKLGAHFQKKKK